MKEIHNSKRDYLITTFSKSKKKDYEHYILNSIWHKLNRIDLQPITQKYVRYKNGQYGVIDLYFPQINFGVECDELNYVNSRKNDKLLKITFNEILDAVDEANGITLRRVKTYESIESIHSQIDEIVNEMKDIISSLENFTPWEIKEANERTNIIEFISIEDDIRFKKISDISNALGKRVKGMQHAYFRLKNDHYVWCPQLVVMYNGELISAGKHGWINQLSDDGEYITESRENFKMEKTLEEHKNHIRITFAKSKDHLGELSFRFVGLFEYDEIASSEEKKVYRRISKNYTV